MLRAKLVILSIVILTTAGCGQMNAVSRNNGGMSFAAAEMSSPDKAMLAQAQALDEITRDMVRAATMKGAASGAAAGCGVALLTASTQAGGKCAMGALTGGGVGALVGNAMGRKQVAERIEIVQLSKVTPEISKAQKSMAKLNDGLTGLLATQDDELALMQRQVATGALSQEAYEARLNDVREMRAELAHALTLSAEQARAAKAALVAAGQQGQTGLDWHIMSADTLDDEATSARSRITLL